MEVSMQWKAMATALAVLVSGAAQAAQPMPVGPVQVAALPPPPPESCEASAVRIESWLGELERRLRLAAEQQPAWTAFADGARASATPMRTLCAAGRPTPPDLGDPAAMMAVQERFETTHLESTRLMRAAVERVAATLTPEQRTRLGEALLPPVPPPPGHGGPGGRQLPPRP
jgi:hypothetical protein